MRRKKGIIELIRFRLRRSQMRYRRSSSMRKTKAKYRSMNKGKNNPKKAIPPKFNK